MAMKVVYIIGNGFDLQIGLPTKYSDFYQYYAGLKAESEYVNKLKDNINNKPENWSDLEIALGNYTANTDTSEEYCEAYDDLQKALRDYILTVDEMMTAGELLINANESTLDRGFTYPERLFGQDVEYTIQGEYNLIETGRTSGEAYLGVNIISFNYTHTVEHYLSNIIRNNSALRKRDILSIQHVHREVAKSQSIWVGVDNDEQIVNERYKGEPDIRCRIIKPWILSYRSRRMIEEAKRLILDADVLVIFGASLGQSDLTWAQLIAKRISSGCLVLLFYHNDKTYISDNAKLNDQIKYRDLFIKKMKELGVKTVDESNIFVEINSPIFTDGNPNPHDANLNAVLQKLQIKEHESEALV